MAGTSIDDALTYATAVRKAFRDEPAKFDEFIEILNDFRAHRLDHTSVIVKMQELMKEHQKLLLRFYAFLPEQTTQLEFLNKFKETFLDEPSKSAESINICNDFVAKRVDLATTIAKLEELMKEHQDLLLDFHAFFKRTIPPKPEQRAAPANNKRKRADTFVRKVKERFQGDDVHVYISFLQILKNSERGHIGRDEAYQELVALLQGHDDLVMELSHFFHGTD